MKLVEQKQGSILLQISVLEAANLLDVPSEVTAQWDDLDTVSLSPSYEQVIALGKALSAILGKVAVT